jgi:UDP-glucose 4-epimerase
MKALVTGGLGFVGSNLTDRLIDQGHEVSVIDDLSSGNSKWINSKVKYYFWDVQEINQKLNEHFDVIYHLAAEARIQPSYVNPLRWQQANINGTSAVCEYARQNNSKVIFAGSSSCYGGKFLNPYTFSKKISEEVCEMYSKVFKISTVTARFFNVYGPRNPSIGEFTPIIAKFRELSKQGKPLTIVGSGTQRRDFTHVDDICQGLIALSTNIWSGEIFNLGTGKNYSILEVAKMFGGDIVYIEARPGESKETLADISKTISKIDWKPKYDLEKYIKEILSCD